MTDRAKARRALYRNGWVVGTLAALVIIIVFLLHYRNVHHPADEVLLVGVPIAVVWGTLVGLAAEGLALSQKKRNMIALLVLAGFAVYIVVLVLYLGSRV